MRKLLLTALAGAACLASAPPSAAGPLGQPIAEDELGEMRGGFITAGGIEIGLGAVVRTLVDGQLALESTISWTDAGPVVTRALAGDTTAADAADLHEAAVNDGLDLQAIAGEKDVFLVGGGGTALVHHIDSRSLLNLVLNVESNLDIRQETELTLTLPGFEAMQQDIIGNLTGLQVGRDMDTAGLGALGR